MENRNGLSSAAPSLQMPQLRWTARRAIHRPPYRAGAYDKDLREYLFFSEISIQFSLTSNEPPKNKIYIKKVGFFTLLSLSTNFLFNRERA